MPARVFEVDAAAAIVVVDLALLTLAGVGPEVEAAGLDAGEDLVEFGFAHQERIVL